MRRLALGSSLRACHLLLHATLSIKDTLPALWPTQKYDGSTWRPDVTVPVAPLEARHAERARKALARELRALRAPVSAHTPFAKSIR